MNKKIMVVGEFWSESDQDTGTLFSGGLGHVLKTMLETSGITWEDCHFTNVFNLRPSSGKLEGLGGSMSEAIEGWPQHPNKVWIRKAFTPHLENLYKEIEYVKPNVIIALGVTPLWALCKEAGIKKYRGTPTVDYTTKYKVLPTYHPAMVLRQWKLRPIVMADFSKARTENKFPDLRRPQRFIYLEPTLEEIMDFYEEHLKDEPFLSCDIETKQGTITEVGFSNASGDHAIVIPFYARDIPGHNYWPTVAQEIKAWTIVRYLCATYPMVGQNFLYDLQYLWRTMGIPCMTVSDDTMILHHSMYPEMEKSLGFLGSIYTNEPSWKFMRKDAEKTAKDQG